MDVHRGPAGLFGGVDQAGEVGEVVRSRVERGQCLGGWRDLPEFLAEEKDAVGVHVPAGLPERPGESIEHVCRPDAQHQVVVAVGHVAAGVALVQREPVGQSALFGSGHGAFQSVPADVDAVGVPVGVVGQSLQRPGSFATAEVEDACRRSAVRPA